MNRQTRRLNSLEKELAPARKVYQLRTVSSSEEARRLEAERKAEEGADYQPPAPDEVRYIVLTRET